MATSPITLLLLLLMAYHLPFVESGPTELLVASLMKDYNELLSPYPLQANSTQWFNVSVTLMQAAIIEIDEPTFTIKMLTSTHLSWTDPRLRWDPASHDGVEAFSIKASGVWRPDISFCDTSAIENALDGENSAKIHWDGSVMLEEFKAISYFANMTFHFFPWDVQEAVVCFFLETFSATRASFKADSNQLPDLVGNSEWTIHKNTTVGEINTEYEGIKVYKIGYQFKVRREPAFWVANVIVPMNLLFFVSSLGLFLGHAEQVYETTATVGLTTMTSIMVTVTILAESLPKAAALAGLGWFVTIVIGLTAIQVPVVVVIEEGRRAAKRYVKNKLSGTTTGAKLPFWVKWCGPKQVYRTRVAAFCFFILLQIINMVVIWSRYDPKL